MIPRVYLQYSAILPECSRHQIFDPGCEADGELQRLTSALEVEKAQ